MAGTWTRKKARAKRETLHCSTCKFVRFLLPSSSWISSLKSDSWYLMYTSQNVSLAQSTSRTLTKQPKKMPRLNGTPCEATVKQLEQQYANVNNKQAISLGSWFFPCSGRKLFQVTLVNPWGRGWGTSFLRVRLVGIKMGLHRYCTNGFTIVARSFKRTGLFSFGMVDKQKD